MDYTKFDLTASEVGILIVALALAAAILWRVGREGDFQSILTVIIVIALLAGGVYWLLGKDTIDEIREASRAGVSASLVDPGCHPTKTDDLNVTSTVTPVDIPRKEGCGFVLSRGGGDMLIGYNGEVPRLLWKKGQKPPRHTTRVTSARVLAVKDGEPGYVEVLHPPR